MPQHIITDAQLTQFCDDQQQRHTVSGIQRGLTYPGWEGKTVFTKGPRYAKIIREEHTSRSSVCFIDLTNGDILKGSWKAPVKNGIRGNIFQPDRGASCMSEYGPKYLR